VTVSGVPGRFGFFELYQPNGCDASVLLRDLGTAFRGELSYSRSSGLRPVYEDGASDAPTGNLVMVWPMTCTSTHS
jgi:hypothetical protein